MPALKILRLGLSDDSYGSLPDVERSWSLAERDLERLTGEPCETVRMANWPTGRQADEVDAEIERIRPDLVFVCAVAYWVSYPSTPLRLRRMAFPGANRMARLGFWAANKPAIADRSAFHLARRMLARADASAFPFTPEVVLDRMDRLIRTVLRHETVILAVRGPIPLRIAGSAALRAECERRRAVLDSGLAARCEKLHVAYRSFTACDVHPRNELLGDRVHVNSLGHRRRAREEFELMSRAWRARSGDQ